MAEPSDSTRIDLWLRLACLVKHRTHATEACQGGHVHVNGRRAKPSTPVRVGDVVEITLDRLRRVVILGVPAHSISKKEAREMYLDESPQPDPALAEIERIAPVMDRDRGAGRPTKRERRDLDRLKSRRD